MLLVCIAAALSASSHGVLGSPLLRLTPLGKTVPEATRQWFFEQAKQTISGGGFRAPSYPYGKKANSTYYCPDDGTDPRLNYDAGTYVRDFTYTFTMAPDLVPRIDIANTLDYFMSSQGRNGEIYEGGKPPTPPSNVIDCWDEGPFLAFAAAKYASLFNDLPWLCGDHPAGGSRLSRLQRALKFLSIGSDTNNYFNQEHLVTAASPHCMYGFTDMEPKQGHVLFTSLLALQGGLEVAAAVTQATARGVQGCTTPGLSKPFAELAAAINASISAGALDDTRFGSGLLLATDMPGHNAQPDVWGSGLAVAIGAGTSAQRAKIAASLATNSSKIFKWGQARHLPLPMCWEAAEVKPNHPNPNQCTDSGAGSGNSFGYGDASQGAWCGDGQPCGSYQNGGYWATPLGWLLPAVASHNTTLAATILADVLEDFRQHGINEAVNHDFVYSPPPQKGPASYTGVMGYLASAASVYSVIWEPAPPQVAIASNAFV